MLCKWCNKEISENAKFCPNCGGNVTNLETQTNEVVTNDIPTIEQNNFEVKEENTLNQQVETINTNTQVQNPTNIIEEKKANVWLVILSVFIPLAGLIIFLVKKDTDKKTAKASGIAALISFIVSIVITIITIITLSFAAGSLIDGAFDYMDDYNSNLTEPDISDNTEVEDNDTNMNNSQNETTSTEWKNYEVKINNTTLKLPCTYNELSNATKAVIQSSYEKSYLQAGYYSIINMYKDDKLALYTEFLNDTEVDTLYTDCKITRISQTKYQTSVGAETIIFPGGLTVGQEITKDEIVNLFGTPSDVYNYESDGYVSDTYTYAEDTYYSTTNNYEIKVVNGVIDELSLDHRNYK